jgi:hypothetical protein
MRHDQFTEPLQDDWQKGDVALCVIGGKLSTIPFEKRREYPQAGSFYTVEAVGEHEFIQGVKKALWFKDAPLNGLEKPQRVWSAKRFIKVTPPADMKLEEEEREKEIAK